MDIVIFAIIMMFQWMIHQLCFIHKHQVLFTFLNCDDTDFHQSSLWRVKLCSCSAEQTSIAKSYAYDRAHFVFIMPCSQLFSSLKSMFILTVQA